MVDVPLGTGLKSLPLIIHLRLIFMSLPIHTVALWRQTQRSNFTSWQKLASYLELDEASQSKIIECSHFPLNLPLRLAQKVEKNNINDPILRQFLPIADELVEQNGDMIDPVGDGLARKCGKLLHKYKGRALLVTTSACAMHCRYCFRRSFPYEREDKSFTNELSLIRDDTTISEILLSGGDPLSLSNETLSDLLLQLSHIDHIKKIRFHTRFPIGIPERIDDALLDILASLPKQVIFVIHVNHPKEIDSDVAMSLKKLMRLGIPILNQSVLLRGVNDSKEVMKDLLECLSNIGVIPYYLHQLDRAMGAGHFATTETEGLKLINELTNELPGYAVPRYVKELAGNPSKTRIL